MYYSGKPGPNPTSLTLVICAYTVYNYLVVRGYTGRTWGRRARVSGTAVLKMFSWSNGGDGGGEFSIIPDGGDGGGEFRIKIPNGGDGGCKTLIIPNGGNGREAALHL
jgi:hypothetical protein